MVEFNWDSFIKELEKFQKGIENIGGYIRETKKIIFEFLI